MALFTCDKYSWDVLVTDGILTVCDMSSKEDFDGELHKNEMQSHLDILRKRAGWPACMLFLISAVHLA